MSYAPTSYCTVALEKKKKKKKRLAGETEVPGSSTRNECKFPKTRRLIFRIHIADPMTDPMVTDYAQSYCKF